MFRYHDPVYRVQRWLFTILMAGAWSGAFRPSMASGGNETPPASTSFTPEQIQEKLRVAREQFDRLGKAMDALDSRLATETYNPAGVISQSGRDPVKLFEWVRDRTAWAPYLGELRGPVGVLMDRTGNSLDR